MNTTAILNALLTRLGLRHTYVGVVGPVLKAISNLEEVAANAQKVITANSAQIDKLIGKNLELGDECDAASRMATNLRVLLHGDEIDQ